MPDPISEEANIDGWLTHFQQQGQYDNIRDWRQRIEDKEARSEHRPSRLIKVEKAVKDFRQALLTEGQYSESAKVLLRKLNRPKPPIVKLLRLQSVANRPAVLTQEQRAYVEQFDRSAQERRGRTEVARDNLPKLLLQDAQKLYSLARRATHFSKLKYRRQARVLEDISDWLHQHHQINNVVQSLLSGSEEDQESAGKLVDKLGQLVMRAARIGLLDHPYIKMYVQNQRSTYNKLLLRKATLGLAARLPRPIEQRQLVIEEWKQDGLSLGQISRRLETLLLNPRGKTLGRKGVHKRLKPATYK